MSKWVVDIHGDIEGDYEIIKEYEEPKTGWIPTNEKMPENGEFIIMTAEDIENQSISVVVGYYRGNGRWYMTDACEEYNDDFYKILAWMPMPKPYKEET